MCGMQLAKIPAPMAGATTPNPDAPWFMCFPTARTAASSRMSSRCKRATRKATNPTSPTKSSNWRCRPRAARLRRVRGHRRLRHRRREVRSASASGGRDVLSFAQILGQAFAHEIDKVLAIEPLDGAGRRAREGIIEALQRIAAAFDVRIVGGEE